MSKHFYNYGGHFNQRPSDNQSGDKSPELQPACQNAVINADLETVETDLSDKNSHNEGKIVEVISRGKLNVREIPSKDGEVVTTVDPGAQLMVQSIDREWTHVYTGSGVEGYVMSEFIKEV